MTNDSNPQEWKECKLSEVARLVKDTYKPKTGDHLPYIGLEHIQEQGLRLLSIGDSDSVTSQKFYFKYNDVLFGKLRPYFRKVVKPNFAGVCSTDIWVVRAVEGNDQDFIFYFFANQELVDTANSGDSGTRMPRADWHFVKDTIWQFPPLPEQRAIAGVLSSLDDKIDLLHRQNKTLEEMAEALWRKMFVEEVDPGWKKGKLGDYGEFKNGINYSRNESGDAEYSILNVRDIVESKYMNVSNFEIISINKGKATPYLLEKGDIVIVRSASPGESLIVLEQIDNLIYSGFSIRLRCYDKENSLFLFQFLQSYKKEMDIFSDGTTLKNINQEILNNIELITPEKAAVKEFNDRVVCIYNKILLNQGQIRTITRLRDTLLPKLMSGEVRVRI